MKNKFPTVLLFGISIVVVFSLSFFLSEITKNKIVVEQTQEWTDELRSEIVADCLLTEGRTERYCNCMVEQVDNYPLEAVVAEVHESTQGGEIINTAESICFPN